MYAINDPTGVQNIIKTAQAQCINAEFWNLDRKVKNLEDEASTLDWYIVRSRLIALKEEIKRSKFPYYFQEINALEADQTTVIGGRQ
jgi:hypothetical protein